MPTAIVTMKQRIIFASCVSKISVLLAKTGDPLAAGNLSLICAVPQFLAGLFGGSILDLCNRRNVSICADCISALSIAMLPIIEWTVGLNFV